MHDSHLITAELASSLELIIISCPLVLAIIFYLVAVYHSNKKYQGWPIYRTVCWSVGVVCVVISLVGPVAERAHSNFQYHMYTHLLLGMLGPLLLAFAAPMTLLLRTLPVKYARHVSKFLKSLYVRFVAHPIIATILNIGALWLLYSTSLFNAMHQSVSLYMFIHLHVFLAGYVFTISMIYIDPTPHRTSFQLRAVTLVMAMAGHNILSKWLYVHPPEGVERTQGELGAMTMYYGGDFIDLIIVIVLCYQHFKVRRYQTEKELLPV